MARLLGPAVRRKLLQKSRVSDPGGGSQGSVPGFTCSLRCLAVEVVVVFNVSYFCSGRSTDYGDQKVRFKCRTTDLHPV